VTTCRPTAPCLAEYGEGFPAFVARRLSQEERSYVASFGELEWCVGAVSIGVDLPTSTGRLDLLDGDTLARATVTLQPGLRYVRADWPVHELLQRFLAESVPDSYELPQVETWLEVRGARGDVAIHSVDAATWAFRRSLQRGVSLEQSCLCAQSIEGGFDSGGAFAAAIAAGLVTGISIP
jgi:hypothetical protein